MKITDFKRGWFIGNFEPSLLKRDFEVGLRWNDKGDKVDRHYHKLGTEYVVFAGGKHRINDQVFGDGDMTIIRPYMSSEYECLEPGYCLTVRDHSDPGDKFTGQPLTVVVPMNGKGQRFKDAGFTVPKPMIPLQGVPMIYRVDKNVESKRIYRMLFVTREDFNYSLPGQVLQLDHETEGAVSTMLEAEHLIGRDDPMVIANCDQLIQDFDIDDFISKAEDCSVTVFKSQVPHHSYVKVKDGLVTEVAEKKVISDLAICGIYFYRKSKYFFDNAKKMIAANDRTNGEFYNSPVFNYIIKEGLKVNVYEVPAEKQHNIGTPEELETFNKKLEAGLIKL